jgi:hypothetical protein
LPAKQMELGREVVPEARRIGVLDDINDPKASPQWQELEAARARRASQRRGGGGPHARRPRQRNSSAG